MPESESDVCSCRLVLSSLVMCLGKGGTEEFTITYPLVTENERLES